MRDNQQASALSRRTVIAALAVGAAANVPAIAAVASASDHPDAELIGLGREYLLLDQAIKAADAHFDRCQAEYKEREPVPGDVMRHRIEDHVCSGLNMPIIPGTGAITADPRYSALYSEAEIDLMEDLLPPWNKRNIPRQEARVAEIIEEWDRWNAECDALSDQIGVTEALETIDDLVARQRPLANKIASKSASTLAGLQVRALILARIFGEDEQDEHEYIDQMMIHAIVRDLVKIAV